MAAPTLWWFGRDGARIGMLHPAGAVEHAEELGGEDALSISCREAPQKYDRILWRDPEDARWREHVVVRTEEGLSGPCAVQAESSLCDLLAGYIEEERLSGASASAALGAVLEGTRWAADASGLPGAASASCLLYHCNRLAALRRVCDLLGCEAEPVIAVSGGKVSARTVRAVPALGAWRGARLEHGRNMAGCARTVLEDEVFTALYGYGAGLPAVDEDGQWSGGYRRKLTFGSVNSGANWVGDEGARLLWGLPDGQGGRVHRFGEVTFPEVGDPEARYTVGSVVKTAYSELSSMEARVAEAEDAAGAAGDAAVSIGSHVTALEAAAGVGAGGEVPALATKEYVAQQIAALDDLSEVEF